jgi:hypothetical protein
MCLLLLRTYKCYNMSHFSMVQQAVFRQDLRIISALRSHSDTPHSVGLLWTSDQPDTKTST